MIAAREPRRRRGYLSTTRRRRREQQMLRERDHFVAPGPPCHGSLSTFEPSGSGCQYPASRRTAAMRRRQDDRGDQQREETWRRRETLAAHRRNAAHSTRRRRRTDVAPTQAPRVFANSRTSSLSGRPSSTAASPLRHSEDIRGSSRTRSGRRGAIATRPNPNAPNGRNNSMLPVKSGIEIRSRTRRHQRIERHALRPGAATRSDRT